MITALRAIRHLFTDDNVLWLSLWFAMIFNAMTVHTVTRWFQALCIAMYGEPWVSPSTATHWCWTQWPILHVAILRCVLNWCWCPFAVSIFMLTPWLILPCLHRVQTIQCHVKNRHHGTCAPGQIQGGWQHNLRCCHVTKFAIQPSLFEWLCTLLGQAIPDIRRCIRRCTGWLRVQAFSNAASLVC